MFCNKNLIVVCIESVLQQLCHLYISNGSKTENNLQHSSHLAAKTLLAGQRMVNYIRRRRPSGPQEEVSKKGRKRLTLLGSMAQTIEKPAT